MKKEAKIDLLKSFRKLTNDDIYNMASKKWKYLSECWYSYDNRQKYKESGTLVDHGYDFTGMSEYYTFQENNYLLYDLGDKYFLEHSCYMPGDGTDHWCYLFNKD